MTIKVEGIGRLNRDLQRLGIEVGDLKAAMAKIAAMGARSAIGHAPRLTGALAGSIRGNKAKNKAVVAAGRGKTSLYAGAINYGWPRHGIKAQPFMQQASKEVEPKVLPMLTQNLDQLIRQKGLG